MALDLTMIEGRKKQGRLILQAIKEAGLSVEQVAKDIGCSRALLYQYIAGTTLAQPDKLTLIAQQTGKPLAFFYGADLVEPETVRTEREGLQKERADWEQMQAEERERRLRERLETLLALSDSQASPPDWKAAASTCEQILPIVRELGDMKVEGLTLFRLGNLKLLMGDLDGAQTALRQAQVLFERLNETAYALACRQSIGRAMLLMGKPDEAHSQFAVAAQSEHWGNRWEATVALSAVAEWTGDFKVAMEYLDEAEELAEQAATERAAQTVHLFVVANRANVYLACGDFAEALGLAKQSLNIAEQLGDRDQQLEAMLTQAVCQRHLGEWVNAHETALRARNLALFADDAERATVAETLLANIAAVTGDFASAKGWGKSALTSALRLRSRRAELWAHKALAETYLREENPDDARYHAQTAVELSEGMRHAAEHAHALCLRAWTNLLGQGRDLIKAKRSAERAFTVADEKGMRHVEGLAAWLLSQIAHEQGDEKAAEWLAEAERLAHEIGDADLLYRCLAVKGKWAVGSRQWAVAITALREANELLTQWRKQWTQAGYDDTWLEEPLRFRACLALVRCLAQKEGKVFADTFVEQVGWLPLQEAWEREQTSITKTVPRCRK